MLSERFKAFAKSVQAEVTRVLPSIEQVICQGNDDDYERAERLTRNLPDMILTIGEQTLRLNELAFEGWEIFWTERAFWDSNEETRKRFKVVIRILQSCVWTWHQRIRMLHSPERERVRTIAYTGSWHAFMSVMLLTHCIEANIVERSVHLERMPLQFGDEIGRNSYVRQMLVANRTNIITNADMIGKYSVLDWKTTIEGLTNLIYRYGLTPSAARLYEALALRYAAWLVHDDRDYAHMTEEEVDLTFDHWTLTREARKPTRADGNNEVDDGDDENDDDPYTGPLPEDRHTLTSETLDDDVLPMNPRLRLSFVIEGEMTIFYALRHIFAMNAFRQHPQARPLIMDPKWRRDMLSTIVNVASEILQDSNMSTETTEIIMSLMMRRHLRPGEAELATFEAGGKMGISVDGDEVMFDMRRVEYNRITEKVLPKGTSTHLIEWQEQLESSISLPFSGTSLAEWDAIAAQRPLAERAALLVLETAFDTFMRANRVNDRRCSLRKFGYMDDAGLVPPLDAPPATPEEACSSILASECEGNSAIFVALAHVYFVIIPEQTQSSPTDISTNDHDTHRGSKIRRILYTPHLVDALAAWFSVGFGRRLIPSDVKLLRRLKNVVENAKLVRQWLE